MNNQQRRQAPDQTGPHTPARSNLYRTGWDIEEVAPHLVVAAAADDLVALVREAQALRADWLERCGDRWKDGQRRALRVRLRAVEADARRLAAALERAVGADGARLACAAAVGRLSPPSPPPPGAGAWDPQP
jgi:hypothetical protein